MKKDPPGKKSKTTSSVEISDLETYSRRQRAYSDSLLLHNLSYAQYNAMPGKRDLREKVSKHIYKPGAEVKERISKGGKVEEHVYKDPDFKLKNGERGIADYWHPEISPTKEYIGYNMDPDNAANMLSTMLVGKDNRKSSMNQLYDKPTQPVVYQPEKKSAPMKKDPPDKKSKAPIYVSDPKDPRLKAYNDSLLLYKAGEDTRNLFLDDSNNHNEANLKKFHKINASIVGVLPNAKPYKTEEIKGHTAYLFKKPVQPVELQEFTPMQSKRPVLKQDAMKDESLSTVPVQNAITYPKDVRRYTAGQYLESQGKSSGYVNFGKNKGREEMKKYQFGGGLNYTGFTPTYTPSTSTSLQFSDPSIANPSIYRAKPSQGTGMSANTTQGLVGAGVAALGSAVQGISAGISAQASVDAIKQAKLKRGLSKVEEGRMRADSLPKTGYYGYTYPKQRMRYGGYGNSGGVAYDPALAAMDPNAVQGQANSQIVSGTAEGIGSAIAGASAAAGPYAAAFGMIDQAIVKPVRAATTHTEMINGKPTERADSAGGAVVNAAFEPHHQKDLDTIGEWFDSSKSGEDQAIDTVGMVTGTGMLIDMIRDASNAGPEVKDPIRTNMGGTSTASGMTYQRGSAVKMKYGGNSKPNAELEGGEIVEKNSGRDINVKGPSHENGGVPKKLDEGDYVWSDHIKYQGKSMADWYAMFKDNPERVEQLRALQEQLAGRAPQMKDGGTLAKYQTGGKQNSSYDIERALELGYELDEEGHMPSRDHLTGRILKSTEHPTFKKGIDADADLGYRGLIGTDGKVYTLNPNDMPTEGNFAPKKYQWGGYRIPTKTQPGFNMFGQYRDNPELGEGMKGVPVPKKYAAEIKAKQEPAPIKVKKKIEPQPEPTELIEPYDPLNDYATVTGPGLGYKPFRPQLNNLSTIDDSDPLEGLPSAADKNTSSTATGERSKAGRFFKQYGAYGIPIAGAMAQLIANGTSEFGDVKVPKAPKITTEKQFLSRATSDAEEAAADRDYKAALDYAEKSGTGPAQQAAAQTAYEDKRSANERTRERTAEINIQQDAKEKGMNLEADLRTKMANAEFEAQRNATLYDRDMAKAEFNRNKGMNVGNIIAGAARDTMSYIGDERHAKAIYGKEGILDRKYGYSEEMLRKNLKGMGLSDAAIEAAVAKDRLDYQSKNKQGTKA